MDLFVCILIIACGWMHLPSLIHCGEIYPEPTPQEGSCSVLSVNTLVPDVQIESLAISSINIPTDLFNGGEDVLNFNLNSGSSKCWYRYIPDDRKFIFLPDQSLSARNYGYQFTVTAINNCSTAVSEFNVEITARSIPTCISFEMLLKSESSTSSCEATHVYHSMKKISQYFHKTLNDVLVLVYEKVLGDEKLLKLTWTFTEDILNCHSCNTILLQKQFISKMVYSNGEINVNFFNFMSKIEEKFTVHYVQYVINCNQVVTTTSESTTTTTDRTTTEPPTTSVSASPNCLEPLVNTPISDVIIPSLISNTFEIPSDTFNSDGFILSLQSIDTQEECWVQLTGTTITFIPSNDLFVNQPSNGYVMKLIATNTCGKTISLFFKVKINQSSWSKCLLMNVFIDHVTCTSEQIIKFIAKLTSYTSNNFMYRAVNWHVTTSGTLKITVALTRDILNCSKCTDQFVNSFKNYFITVNNGNIKQLFKDHFAPNINIRDVKFITSEPCNQCQPIKITTIHLSPGISFLYDLDVSTKHVSLQSISSNHPCWLRLLKPQTIVFVPTYQLAHYHKETRYNLIITNTCQANQKVEVIISKIYAKPCFKVKLSFYATRLYSCMAESVRKMVSVVAAYLKLKSDDVRIVSYNISSCKIQHGSYTPIDVVFTLSNAIIPHVLCSSTIIQSYVELLIGQNGEIHQDFLTSINGRFVVHDISYYKLTSSEIDLQHANYTTSYVSLWLYFLPLFILLFVLILLLLCCCCSAAFYRCFKSCCCACCFRAHPVATAAKETHSKGVTGGIGSYTGYDMKGSSNTVSTEESNKSAHLTNSDKYLSSHSTIVSDKVGTINPSIVVVSTVDKMKSNSDGVTADNKILRSSVDGNRVVSVHTRSYSDSDLLDDTLNLPSIPLSSMRRSRRFETRRSFNSRYDRRSISNGGRSNNHEILFNSNSSDQPRVSFKSLQKITIPVKLTTRVKNVSTIPATDLDLRSFRPTRIEVNSHQKQIPDVFLLKPGHDKKRITLPTTPSYDDQFFYHSDPKKYRTKIYDRFHGDSGLRREKSFGRRSGFVKFVDYSSDSEV